MVKTAYLISERIARCMTRALKNAVMQQQVFQAEKALQILDQETAPLVVDRDKLKVCVYLIGSIEFHFSGLIMAGCFIL